jgi:carboxymethylenebutenolidase
MLAQAYSCQGIYNQQTIVARRERRRVPSVKKYKLRLQRAPARPTMLPMSATPIEIRTQDGICPSYVFGDRNAPSVLVYIDGIGMRPAMHEIAERIATAGYHVLLPDVFYRMGPYTAPDPKALFTDPAVRSAWFAKAMAAMSGDNAMRDTRAFLDYFPGAVAVAGYCMGGRMAIVAAAAYPDRIVAAAAYHPGGLVSDAADSPHLLAPKIKAKVYIGRASDDANFTDEQEQRLEKALTDAHVDHVIELYPAKHGWVPSDTPVHDPAAAARHDSTLLALLDKTLR